MCLPPPHPILRGGAHVPLPSNKYILKQQREDFVREWGEEREYRERGTGHVKVIFLMLIHYIIQNLFAKTVSLFKDKNPVYHELSQSSNLYNHINSQLYCTHLQSLSTG